MVLHVVVCSRSDDAVAYSLFLLSTLPGVYRVWEEVDDVLYVIKFYIGFKTVEKAVHTVGERGVHGGV